jgi:hypothetical protein
VTAADEMAFILAEQRDADVDAAFESYHRYLRDNKARFPPSAYALATADWYFAFSDRRCPHDAWLEAAVFEEPSTGERHENRSSKLTVTLLGAYHDGYIEFVYPEVYAYQIDMPYAADGHGDWRYDEFRVGEQGQLVHEIEWAAARPTGRWLIEASDVLHRWIPRKAIS